MINATIIQYNYKINITIVQIVILYHKIFGKI